MSDITEIELLCESARGYARDGQWEMAALGFEAAREAASRNARRAAPPPPPGRGRVNAGMLLLCAVLYGAAILAILVACEREDRREAFEDRAISEATR